MITNFENITEDLTELEKKFIPEIKEIIDLSFRSKTTIESDGVLISETYSDYLKRPIKQKELSDIINYELIQKHGLFVEIKINSVRLRKYFNYFRTNGILPLIATSDGCYISTDKTEIEKQILSMKERARQILRAADGLNKFLI